MTYFKLFRDLHGPWSGPCAHSGGCHVGRVWPPLARPSSQWMIGIYWNIIHDEYIPVYFGHIHCGLNMDDIPVYFMMFIYIYCLWCLSHHKPHHKHILLQHTTLTAYSSALSILVHRSKHVQTRQGFLAPGSNPMLVMALANPSTDKKKPGWVIWVYSVALSQESDMACWKISYLVRCFFHEK